MFYTYVIKSFSYERYYIGSCTELNTRLKKHNSGSVRSTKFYKPWQLVYSEEYPTKTEARKRENELKNNYQIRKRLIEKLKK